MFTLIIMAYMNGTASYVTNATARSVAVSTSTIPFATQEACLQAEQEILKHFATASTDEPSVRVVCVKTSGH